MNFLRKLRQNASNAIDHTVSSTKYRPDIDGLRALAIIAVVLYHLNNRWLPGGFLGVDVFFVISGYLITSIIRNDLERNDFSFARFYEKRARRILPAFFVVLIFTTIVCYFYAWPNEFRMYAKSMRYALLSCSNIYFGKSTQNYFHSDSDNFPLLHTWSLGIEEQFYFFIPLILFIVHKKKIQWITLDRVLWIFMILSYLACLWKTKNDSFSGFYIIFYRAWELLIGALLTTQAICKIKDRRLLKISSFMGLALVIFYFFYSSSDKFSPTTSSLLVCIGTAMIIHSGISSTTYVHRALSVRALVGLGLLSYSIYIWHWPIIVFCRPITERYPSLIYAVAVISIIISWASWKWIETPWRRSSFLPKKRLYAIFGTTALLLMIFAVIADKTRGLPQRYRNDVQSMLETRKRSENYHFIFKHGRKYYDPNNVIDLGDKSSNDIIAVWGDSHALSLLPALEPAALKHHFRLRTFMLPGQAPIAGLVIANNQIQLKKTFDYSHATLEHICANQQIRTVVMHGRWSAGILGPNEIKNFNSNSIRYWGQPSMNENERCVFYGSMLQKTIDRLINAGKRVFLIYSIPEPELDIPKLLASSLSKNEDLPETIPLSSFSARQKLAFSALNGIKDHPQIVRIKPHEKMLQNNQLIIQVNGNALYYDDDHLSNHGAELISPLLDPIFAR
jgi:peptidoglycan/LPS O-acetylase OafA/YrhL